MKFSNSYKMQWKSILEHHQPELEEADESFHGQEDSDNLVSAKQLWSGEREGESEREREREREQA